MTTKKQQDLNFAISMVSFWVFFAAIFYMLWQWVGLCCYFGMCFFIGGGLLIWYVKRDKW